MFYSPDIETDPILPETDSGHCVRVLRYGVGQMIDVVDGRGSLFRCRIVDAHPKHTMLEIVEKTLMPLPWQQNITIAVAPTKHLDRMEWLVEKLVEVGVNRIILLKCRYSERKEIKEERLQKIAVSAMKQSLKTFMPEILPMMPFDKALRHITDSQRFIAYCSDEFPKQLLSHDYIPHRDVVVMIGPEGDFSPEEVRQAIDSGYRPVTLGDTRLRTETAALYSCAAIHVADEIKTE